MPCMRWQGCSLPRWAVLAALALLQGSWTSSTAWFEDSWAGASSPTSQRQPGVVPYYQSRAALTKPLPRRGGRASLARWRTPPSRAPQSGVACADVERPPFSNCRTVDKIFYRIGRTRRPAFLQHSSLHSSGRKVRASFHVSECVTLGFQCLETIPSHPHQSARRPIQAHETTPGSDATALSTPWRK